MVTSVVSVHQNYFVYTFNTEYSTTRHICALGMFRNHIVHIFSRRFSIQELSDFYASKKDFVAF